MIHAPVGLDGDPASPHFRTTSFCGVMYFVVADVVVVRIVTGRRGELVNGEVADAVALPEGEFHLAWSGRLCQAPYRLILSSVSK